VLGAADIGANHQRDRIWIVARQRERIPYPEYHGAGRGKQQQESPTRPHNDVANIEDDYGWSRGCVKQNKTIRASWSNKFSGGSTEMAYSTSIGQQGQRQHEQPIHSAQGSDRQANYAESIGRPNFWSAEPNVGRVADGVASRMDRLKAIGNGQVPLCAATAWRILNA